jgi:murein L,D-transpeptidase YcbB/YkuD
MKQITVVCLSLLVLLFSCRDSEEGNTEPQKKVTKKPSERDLSITKENSYSDLFLDSNRVENFIKQQKLDDNIAEELRLFYNRRNFQYAWFSSDGLTEQALGFRSLYDYKKDSGVSRKSLDNRLDDIMTDTAAFTPSSDIAKTELLLSWRFINYINDTYRNGSVKKKALVRLIPAKKQEILKLAERILRGDEYDFSSGSDSYKPLKNQLERYVELAKSGGWQNIPSRKKALKKGMSDTAIVLIKKRLHQTGNLPGRDTSKLFTEDLEPVIRSVQTSFGQKGDGIIGPSFIKELNVPAIERVQQIIVNLERMRWMPDAPEGRLIEVNIPEFKLHVHDRKEKAFDMEVVVGKEGNSTIMFSGELNQIVFSPYWNLPRSIVRNEVMPGMERDPDYLIKHNMEITGEENGLPVVRQLPGETNALGKVKFLFPNTFNIYFHDTPEKELFKKSKRAYSHGCIRLSDPEKMANYLLEEDINWSPEKIDSAMNSGKEKYVRVKDPVPVLIHYYTAWVDEAGVLQFRDDIYNHDKNLARKMFLDARVPEKMRKEILASK